MSPIFVSLSKNLVFVPVASAMIAVHQDRLVLTSNALWMEIQPQGHIVSSDLPTIIDNYKFEILVCLHA